MKRTAATAATLVLVGLSVSTASAATPKVDAHGTANCTIWSGKATFKPGLVAGGIASSVAVKFKAKLVCTGTSGVASGSLKASGTASSNDCAAQSDPPVLASGTIKWKGAVKYNPSAISASNASASIDANNVEIDVPSPGPNPPAGTTVIMGSFSGQHAVATLLTDQTGTAFAATCASKKGVKSVTFTGVTGPSTFKIS